ncbi:NAD(P)-binding protein [Paraflavisolibacter sp. H34]|uniref:flavin monoamine oxidase family protein n=1 Tax=Huijunlia imazamoxiresistens TaxID=3127457 RepID=UPI003016D05B
MDRRTFLQTAAAAAGITSMAPGCAALSPLPGKIIGASAAAGHQLRDRSFGPPSEIFQKEVVIIGGGISGLSAARRLHQSGLEDFMVLDLESVLGGNAAQGANRISAYPWGAHYVPTPNNDLHEYLQFLEESGVITGRNEQGLPVYNEYYLCFDPQERLYLNGQWQDSLVPHFGVPPEEKAQIDRFFRLMDDFRHRKGSDGKDAFALPVNHSSTDEAFTRLDRLTMQQWLQHNGFTSPYLHGHINYCTRDDFGTPLHQVSAWAGIHYFAARKGRGANAGPSDVLTWPEGNGWLATRLQKGLEGRLQRQALAVRVEPKEDAIRITFLDTLSGRLWAVDAGHCIAAVPQFVAARLLGERERIEKVKRRLSYAPWMVANLAVSELEERSGAPASWDNVLYDSPSLGYVDATHNQVQQGGTHRNLTYYLPLTAGSPAEERRAALARTHSEWVELIFDDLQKVHPNLRKATKEVHVMLWGHAMAQPLPGSIWGGARAELSASLFDDRLHFAHTDLAGVSLFEEAFYQGLGAADSVLKRIQRK